MDKADVNKAISNFLDIKTLRELSRFLEIDYSILTYYLYRVKEENKYSEFEIKKRNGESRKITAPIPGMKHIQSSLNYILQHIFPPKTGIHGFTLNKSIKSNATAHLKKRIIINLDLKDFFPSINFGRVRGLFLAPPFSFNTDVATALAQICCYKNSLPQGSPTSPILSNFICRRLDNKLVRLVTENKLTYTRYADDITISTNLKCLPPDIGCIVNNKIILGTKLIQIIENNGFTINELKTRFAFRTNRQEVTGLVVNETVNVSRKYVRNIRAMLHSWEKYGVSLAATEHFTKYKIDHNSVTIPEVSFKNELVGKIGFVGFIKGKTHPVYRNLQKRLNDLAPEVRIKLIQDEVEQESNPVVFGEGKTDWKHLKKALEALQEKGLYRNLFLKFHEYNDNDEINNDQLLDICKTIPKTNLSKNKLICVFDRDVKKFNDAAVENGNLYKHWGRGVYSLLLPKPPHRNFEEVCIEHYYLDEDLKKVDSNGRRIYLSNEFNNTDGQHLMEDLRYTSIKHLNAKYPKMLDNGVLNKAEKNVALSKNTFSKYILDGVQPFNNVSFDYFRLIFEEIEKIVNFPES